MPAMLFSQFYAPSPISRKADSAFLIRRLIKRILREKSAGSNYCASIASRRVSAIEFCLSLIAGDSGKLVEYRSLGSTNLNLIFPKSQAFAADYRALMKSSETAPNKGFFAICSPNPFIKCYAILTSPGWLIRAKTRANGFAVKAYSTRSRFFSLFSLFTNCFSYSIM